MMLAISALMGWEIRQLDVVTAFLNPEIDNDNIWIALPVNCVKPMLKLCPRLGSNPSFTRSEETRPKDTAVLCLKKALYRLRQSPRLWWKKIDGVLLDLLGFSRAVSDTNLYFLQDKLMLLLYVDDIAILNMEHPKTFALDLVIAKLTDNFKMKDLGKIQRFLGFEVNYLPNGVSLRQRTYINTLIE